ncbi:glycosyltransferase family 25 protein [Acinetobacter qingfengensis]|uniref:Glycosyl transferase n=1 Tax=Acinetobacter qingfengensis TaxID=1262585 RepID=A0A1E7R3G8_9GAMM|nr:glycosyltransferase family 25 protein [Acinetobacter qingfengensis]KAA8733187.1 glycosyltransferase family 25 protein [Acinetobacter qingfengensis]OEY93841.1 glycosyl transferase [Acinetobacter qingfengensis]
MKLQTYLINLDGSEKRFNSAKAQLDRQNISFERFSAYDGRGKMLSEFEHYNDQQAQLLLGRSLLNSEIGCYLSHYGCVEKFLKSDADYLIVLEDDMKIGDNFKQTIDQIFDYLDQHPKIDWYLMNIAAKKKKFAKDIIQFDQYSLWHAYYFPIRGLGLIWSRKGAEQFIKAAYSIYLPVDIFFQTWLSKNGKGLGVWPALVRPAGLDSDILGTVASQGITRKQKENRQLSYEFKKQKRMWRDRLFALKHLISLS